MTKKTVYEVKSCIQDWLEEAIANQSGVSCVHIEAQMKDKDDAIALAKKLTAEKPSEFLEVRQYPGDVCVWTSK